jgi:hypothetical protein
MRALAVFAFESRPIPPRYNRCVVLWLGQFGIAHGQAQEETPWVGVFPDDMRGPDSSDLLMIVQPATAGSEEFCAELKEAVGSVFHKSKVSLTGGLLRALREAHENLREWNRRSLRDHWVAAGVSCVAVRANEAYLAQVAPAGAAFYGTGETRPIRPQLADALEPLGMFDEFWPEFSLFEMQDRDRLLLMTPGLAQGLSKDLLGESLALPAEDVLPSLYRRASAVPDCAAVLVAGLPSLDGEVETVEQSTDGSGGD